MKSIRTILKGVFVIFLSWGTAYAHKLADDASPGQRAFAYRDGLMHTIGPQMGVMSMMAQGKRPVDNEAFSRAANRMVELSKIVPDAFTMKALMDESLAKPGIWEDWNDFVAKSEDLTKQAEAVARAASEGGFEAAKGMVKGLGEACAGCHKQYKVKKD